MELEYLKKNTQNLIILNKNSLRTLESRENVLNANIKYWLKKGEIFSLKKGMYILKDTADREKNKDALLEYLAEQMVQPSYLSVEYTLAKYQILSEPVQGLTLVTIKKTQEIKNKLGVFRYYSITEKLFTGYENKNINNLIIFEATKAKALFDFLYFRFLKERPVDEIEVDNLRLNWENISQKDFQEAKNYLKLTNSQKLKELFKIIQRKYYA